MPMQYGIKLMHTNKIAWMSKCQRNLLDWGLLTLWYFLHARNGNKALISLLSFYFEKILKYGIIWLNLLECNAIVIFIQSNSNFTRTRHSPKYSIWYQKHYSYIDLKGYYEIVDEARPLSGFFPTHADFFMEMHF